MFSPLPRKIVLPAGLVLLIVTILTACQDAPPTTEPAPLDSGERGGSVLAPGQSAQISESSGDSISWDGNTLQFQDDDGVNWYLTRDQQQATAIQVYRDGVHTTSIQFIREGGELVRRRYTDVATGHWFLISEDGVVLSTSVEQPGSSGTGTPSLQGGECDDLWWGAVEAGNQAIISGVASFFFCGPTTLFGAAAGTVAVWKTTEFAAKGATWAICKVFEDEGDECDQEDPDDCDEDGEGE